MPNFMTGWHLLYTRPHHEARVSGQLQDKEIRTYLPVMKEKRKWSDRIKTVEVPLFPSYLFVYLNNSQEFYEGTRVEGSCYYVRSGGRVARMSEEDIDQIRVIETNGVNMEVAENNFQPGQVLVIQNGPFNGLSCEVIQHKGRERILVRVSIINRGVLADLPTSALS